MTLTLQGRFGFGAHPASCKLGPWSFPGQRRPGRRADSPPHLVCRGPRKSRGITLLTLRAFVAYKKGGNLPTLQAKEMHISNDALESKSLIHEHLVFVCLVFLL